jgi:hypothetical protein
MMIQESGGAVASALLRIALYTEPVAATAVTSLTDTQPFLTVGQSSGNLIMRNENAWFGLRLTHLGGKFVGILNNRSQYVIGNQSTDGTVAVGAVTNILGMEFPPNNYYSYPGIISTTKTCIITNGIAAIGYL